MTWTPAMDQIAETMWLDGQSSRDIARRLTDAFRPVSFNAVIGRARRKQWGKGGHGWQQRKGGPREQAPETPERTKTCEYIADEPSADDSCKCGAEVFAGTSWCEAHYGVVFRLKPEGVE